MSLPRTTPKRQVASNPTDPYGDLFLTRQELEQFKTGYFQVGPSGLSTATVDCLAAIFDLEGFTTFCSQNDPQLIVPSFLERFNAWFFGALAKLSVEKTSKINVRLWCPLPVFAKFLGDGYLLIWHADEAMMALECGAAGLNARAELEGDVTNIVSVLYDIVRRYVKEFLPTLKNEPLAPRRLRCGVAMGRVCVLNGGEDYVGPCINTASRLQKLGSLSMAVSSKGINLGKNPAPLLAPTFERISVPIRGSQTENIYVPKKEWEKLTAIEQSSLLGKRVAKGGDGAAVARAPAKKAVAKKTPAPKAVAKI
jgi:hypothetical protein